MNGGQEKHAAPKAPAGKGNELIREKKQVQVELKDLNRRIKELKQLLRGGRIDEPLNPALSELAQKIVQDMSQAANEVKELAKEQSEYAAKQQARKGGPVAPPGPPVADVPSAPAEQKLEFSPALLQAASLELPPSLASSRWTRLMTYVKTPFQRGDADRWERLKLLRTAADINSSLKDIENAALTSQDIAIPSAVYKAGALYHIIEEDLVERLLTQLGAEEVEEDEGEEAKPDETPDISAPDVPPVPTGYDKDLFEELRIQVQMNTSKNGEYWNRLGQMQQDLARLRAHNVPIPERLEKEVDKGEVEKYIKNLYRIVFLGDPQKLTYDGLKYANDNVLRILDIFEAQIMSLAHNRGINLRGEPGPIEVQPPETAPNIPEPDQSVEGMSVEEALIKLADTALERKLTHNYLTRYLKRKWVAIFGGPTRGLRLSAAQSARDAREKLNQFMDVLEQPSSFREIARTLIPFLNTYRELLPKIVRLGDEYNKFAELRGKELRAGKERITITPIKVRDLNQLNQMRGQEKEVKTDAGTMKVPAGSGLLMMAHRLRKALVEGAQKPKPKPEEEQEGEAA